MRWRNRLVAIALLISLAGTADAAESIDGRVLGGGTPIAHPMVGKR